MNNNCSEEFIFIRDKLKRVASLLITSEKGDVIEAAFMIGTLHTVCHENSIRFHNFKNKED